MSKAIFISDSHGCKKYLQYVIDLAKENKIEYIFHCGDIGNRRKFLRWFAEETKGLYVFLKKGNHDRMRKLRKIDKQYEHIDVLNDGIFQLEDACIVSKGLPFSMHMGKRYRRSLDQMLEKVSKEERVILFTHYNTLDHNRVLNIHGHKHINKWWMYVISGRYCSLKKLKKYHHKDNTYSINVALRALQVDLNTLELEWLL
jgi:predicted phosphodiesterase